MTYVVLAAFAGNSLPAYSGNGETPAPTLETLRALRTRKIGDYFPKSANSADSAAARQRLRGDLDFARKQAEDLGIFKSTPELDKRWKSAEFTDRQLKELADASVTSAATLLYTNFAAEEATAVDAKSKKPRKGKPSAGDEDFAEKTENVDTEKSSNTASIILTATIGAVSGFILPRIIDVFFHGPVGQMMNSGLEPLVRPIRERIDRWTNTYIAPRTVKYAMWVSGEGSVRKKALQQAKDGEKLTGNAERFSHPAISVEDFAKDHEIFYDEFMKADYRWRGWMAPEYIRARNTGMELLYGQWTSLGERISTYESNANSIRTLIAVESRPELLAAGAKSDDIVEFVALLEKKQDILVFDSLQDPRIADLDIEIQSIMKRWLDLGIPAEKIEDFYELNVSHFISKNRPAFGLAAMLDNERYFQENNLALKGLDQIQKWQEQAREMVGYYDALRKYGDRIERFFKRKKLNYSLSARLAERGYPLGGERRPVDAVGVRYCRDLLNPLLSTMPKAPSLAEDIAKAI